MLYEVITDFVIVAEFDDVAAWRADRDHPTHVLLIEELIVGRTLDRVAGQFQTPDERDARDVSAVGMAALLASAPRLYPQFATHNPHTSYNFV